MSLRDRDAAAVLPRAGGGPEGDGLILGGEGAFHPHRLVRLLDGGEGVRYNDSFRDHRNKRASGRLHRTLPSISNNFIFLKEFRQFFSPFRQILAESSTFFWL